ncbi:XrtA-associated tyrosine autokinase [Roseateles depolymerans]|uniref:non-specific protein-tyrosine kinase n=1 Tax=Roseateles depolymerans TaxID=76731 RepID=A0A0U3MWI1_9BURK|nr:XrtA-associated tyrosine autokinase [Roseateles depolymerans]ALV06292.1 Non-specific protein-tyrosine kinase [Roseateles depolymerans]REG19262.1 exopolysaccharide/PEP-CTERM locus tyrosine autokinase [Roseateles depolymerans]
MTSLIEQAARRLEQLKQAGVDVASPASPAGESAATAPAAQGAPVGITTPGAGSSATAAAAAPFATHGATPVVSPPSAEAAAPRARAPQDGTSKRVELDLEALTAQGFLTPNAPRSYLADQYRNIKRPLIRNAMGKGAATLNNANLIMVTSALPGEGKSFTSLNLAMSIAAEFDNTVMLVDADVARPSMLRMLGLPPGPGLLDVLENSVDMADVLIKTNVDKLTLLPSGRPHDRATELLASDAMTGLLDHMAKRYSDRIIIFDSPPLLLTTESRVLATHMGQIVVVIQAERTPQSAVMQAIATIESCPLKMALLNQASAKADAGYGYHYGSYGYGQGYGYGYRQGDSPDGADGARPATGKA